MAKPELSIKPPFEAYHGDRPYIFVSYAHADSAKVYAELVWLKGQGYDIWFDEGISPGHDWPEELAAAIEGCALFLLFVTPQSARRENCVRETTFAMSRGRPFLAVHLDETQLPPGLELSIGHSQAILKYAIDQEAYRRKLQSAVVGKLGLDATAKPPADIPTQREPRQYLFVWVAAVVVIVGGALALLFTRETLHRDADADIARLRQIVGEEKQTGFLETSKLEAFLLARKLQASGTPASTLEPYWEQIAVTGEAKSSPDGVAISLKASMNDAQWIDIGMSGHPDVRFPRGQFFWRFEKAGYRTQIRYQDSAFLFSSLEYSFLAPRLDKSIYLADASEPPIERVPKGLNVPSAVNMGMVPWKEVPSFRVARYEVTNKEYAEFVVDGGYQDPKYFAELAEHETFAKAAQFVDRTGRPGPAAWEVGTYPRGEADFPVGGISWYEAMAYARYRHASLPTIYHWTQAALPMFAWALASSSNLNSERAKPVESLTVPEPNGTYGMYGNVREWLINAWGDRRWILGGGWSDAKYMSATPFSLPPEDRAPMNGIRLFYFSEPYPSEFDQPFEASYNDYRAIKAVSDDTYAVIAEQYVDVGGPIHAEVVARKDEQEWVHETVRLNSDIAGEFFNVQLFLPKGSPGPLQVVTYFPESGVFWRKSDSGTHDLRHELMLLDTIPRGGRALVWPIYYGSFERYFGIYEMPPERRAQLQTELRVHWYADLKRTLDYLETRKDLDMSRLAWLGYSFGAGAALPLLALEKRFDAAILVAGGLGNIGFSPMPQAADPVNFISRIKVPVLMINGRNDFVFPLETSQQPLFDLLGTAPADKIKIVYDGDHNQIPSALVNRDIANWLDARLGRAH